jgi:hypothetical protein
VSLRVLLSGMVAGDPHQGGATWAVLQYAIGLRELGHDVVFVEPVDEDRDPSVDTYFTAVVEAAGLHGRAALLVRGKRDTVGVPYATLVAAAREADVVLNISGMLRDEELVEHAGVRVFLDLDPAFNQLWHAVDGVDVGLDLHNRFATVGLAIGAAGCPVPTCGHDWVTTVPPVVLSRWPAASEPPGEAFTTVANWRGYGSIQWGRRKIGQKAHSMRRLIDLPGRAPAPVVVALAIHPDERDDLALLDAHGWRLADPGVVAATPAAYAAFVRGSRGELGIAKSGYVASRCGWFSDRSACYLASGRPVVAQDTGWSTYLPAGDGLLAFDDVAGAVAGMERLMADPIRHARAARALAEDLLDARRVLPELLDAVA